MVCVPVPGLEAGCARIVASSLDTLGMALIEQGAVPMSEAERKAAERGAVFALADLLERAHQAEQCTFISLVLVKLSAVTK